MVSRYKTVNAWAHDMIVMIMVNDHANNNHANTNHANNSDANNNADDIQV